MDQDTFGLVIDYAYWVGTFACICATVAYPWFVVPAIIGFGYSLRIAHLMGECRGLDWEPGDP